MTMVVNPVRHVQVEKERQQRRAQHDLGRRERSTRSSHGAAAAELVAAECECDERPEERGHHGRDAAIRRLSFIASTSAGYWNGSRQASSENDFQTKLNFPAGLLKLYNIDHEDRQEQIRQHQHGVPVEEPRVQPPHQARSSVPSTLAYASTPSVMTVISTKDSDAASG